METRRPSPALTQRKVKVKLTNSSKQEHAAAPSQTGLEGQSQGEALRQLQGLSQRSQPVLPRPQPRSDVVPFLHLHPGPSEGAWPLSPKLHRQGQAGILRTGRDPEHCVPGSRQKHIFCPVGTGIIGALRKMHFSPIFCLIETYFAVI